MQGHLAHLEACMLRGPASDWPAWPRLHAVRAPMRLRYSYTSGPESRSASTRTCRCRWVHFCSNASKPRLQHAQGQTEHLTSGARADWLRNTSVIFKADFRCCRELVCQRSQSTTLPKLCRRDSARPRSRALARAEHSLLGGLELCMPSVRALHPLSCATIRRPCVLRLPAAKKQRVRTAPSGAAQCTLHTNPTKST